MYKEIVVSPLILLAVPPLVLVVPLLALTVLFLVLDSSPSVLAVPLLVPDLKKI